MTAIKNYIQSTLWALGVSNDVVFVRWNNGACEIVLNDCERNGDYRPYNNTWAVVNLSNALNEAATKVETSRTGSFIYFVANNTFSVKYRSSLLGR